MANQPAAASGGARALYHTNPYSWPQQSQSPQPIQPLLPPSLRRVSVELAYNASNLHLRRIVSSSHGTVAEWCRSCIEDVPEWLLKVVAIPCGTKKAAAVRITYGGGFETLVLRGSDTPVPARLDKVPAIGVALCICPAVVEESSDRKRSSLALHGSVHCTDSIWEHVELSRKQDRLYLHADLLIDHPLADAPERRNYICVIPKGGSQPFAMKWMERIPAPVQLPTSQDLPSCNGNDSSSSTSHANDAGPSAARRTPQASARPAVQASKGHLATPQASKRTQETTPDSEVTRQTSGTAPQTPNATPLEVVPKATPAATSTTPQASKETLKETSRGSKEASQDTKETLAAREVAPKVPDAAPKVPDAAPKVADAAPKVADAAPKVANAAPMVENAAPMVENAAPMVENAAPKVATNSVPHRPAPKPANAATLKTAPKAVNSAPKSFSPARRKRGRPKGSKNKPKPSGAATTAGGQKKKAKKEGAEAKPAEAT